MIRVKCDCGQVFTAKDGWAGKSFKCTDCGKSVRIPRVDRGADASSVLTSEQLLDESSRSGMFLKVILPVATAAGILIAFLVWKNLPTDQEEESPLPAATANESATEADVVTPNVLVDIPVESHAVKADALKNKPKLEPQETPVVITLPSRRKFHHNCPILDGKPTDYMVAKTVAMETDDGTRIVFADILFDDEAQDGKDLKVRNFGQLRFFSYDKNWSKMDAKRITVVLDIHTIVMECRRSGKMIITDCHLSDFARMLNSLKIEFEVGPTRFNLTGRHIEGMRDLASQLPDGETRHNVCVIRHEPDTAVEPLVPKLGAVRDPRTSPVYPHVEPELKEDSPVEAASKPTVAKLKRSKASLESAKKLINQGRDAAAKKCSRKQ